MALILILLFVFGLYKLITYASRQSPPTINQWAQNRHDKIMQQASDAKDYMNECNKSRSVATFFQNYNAMSSQIEVMQRTRNRTTNRNARRYIDSVTNTMLYPGEEKYEWMLRNTIERQCNDTVKNIRTTYRNSSQYRDAAYNNFLNQMQVFSPYFTNSETQEIVNRSIERVRYEYNGFTKQIPFRNDVADYERSLLTPKLRYDILRRDGFRCTICGRGQEDGVKLHVDHIKPVSKGGRTVPENLRTLCQDCNLGKSDSYYEGEYN